MKHEWWQGKQDPYDTLVDLVNFCKAADTHITNTNENIKVLVQQHNKLKQDYEQMKHRIIALEAVATEIIGLINGKKKD